jgi:hypothetical protein
MVGFYNRKADSFNRIYLRVCPSNLHFITWTEQLIGAANYDIRNYRGGTPFLQRLDTDVVDRIRL